VFWNLLSNAVKFTERGGQVGIRVVQRAGGVEAHIWDSGRGLSAEECRRAFEPYWQHARGDGLGLGLLIARRLVELHGGALGVTSAGEGRGADFVVALPVRARTPDAPAVPVLRAV
jgi:signal transduction histidine kinase